MYCKQTKTMEKKTKNLTKKITCKFCKYPDARISLEEYRKYVICGRCGEKTLLREYNVKRLSYEEYNQKVYPQGMLKIVKKHLLTRVIK